MIALLLSLSLSISVRDQIDGAEIGDAVQSVEFQTNGKYVGQRTDDAGKTHAKGSWRLEGDRVIVEVNSCSGPACKTFGKNYAADLAIVAERAMTVKSDPPDSPLSTGSYYCHYGACEKRLGVLVLTHSAKAAAMRYVLDFLIDKNRSRDSTVVWWGSRLTEHQPRNTLVSCAREPERAKQAADLVAKDLAELTWVGKVESKPGPKDCLYDAMLVVNDDAMPPAKK